MRSSALTRTVFPLFAWGLAFHSLFIALLFGWFGLPEGFVRLVAGWKDVVLFLLLAIVIVRALSGRGPAITLTWTDFWIVSLFSLSLLYLAGENLWLRADLPVSSELLGIRQAVLFMLIYFVGRGMPDLVDDDG